MFELARSRQPLQANLTISPGHYSFENTPIGTTSHEIFIVRAHSRANSTNHVVLQGIAINNPEFPTNFSIDPMLTTCEQGQTLRANQQCEIVVDFIPSGVTAVTTAVGELYVISNCEEVRPKNGVVILSGGGEKR